MFLLSPKSGNTYKGTVTKDGVQFTNQATDKTSTGVWKNEGKGYDPVFHDVKFTQESGDLAGFSFHFSPPGWHQDAHAKFTFGGTEQEGKSALEKAGFESAVGIHKGEELRSEGGEDGRNSTHVTLYAKGQYDGNLHTGETNPNSPLNVAIHAVEVAVNIFEWGTRQKLGGKK